MLILVKRNQDMSQINSNINKINYNLVSTNDKSIETFEINDDEEQEDETVLAEFEQISILGASRMSLRNRTKSQLESKKAESIEKKKPENKLKDFLISYRGSLFALLSAFIQSIIIIMIKKTFLLSAPENVLIRYAGSFLIMLTICKYKDLNHFGPKEFRKILYMRGFIGVIGMTCSVFALTYIKVNYFDLHSKIMVFKN